MRNFFMRYGFIFIVVFFITVGFICVTPFGRKMINDTAEAAQKITETRVYKFIFGGETIEATQDLDNYGYFTVIVNSGEYDSWEIEYNYSDSSALWSGWNPVYETVSLGEKEHRVYFHIDRIEPGIRVKFRATKVTEGRPKQLETGVLVCE